ncbi:hypothetical protein D3C71_1803700 [compost metagenome]
MVAPLAGHDRRYAVQRALGDVSAFDIGEVFAREYRVSMAEHDGVNARNLAEVVHRILCHRLVRLAGQAGVRDRHDQIGPLFTHFRHVAFGGFGDVVDLNLALQIGLIPHQNLRWHKTDIADA